LILWGSCLLGGIREDVEKHLYRQFGDSIILTMKKVSLDKNITTKIEKKVHQRFFKDFIYTWTIHGDNNVVAYGLLDNVKGLSMPITFLVIYDVNGNIMNSHVVKYREPYGGEIASKKWNGQFVGRSGKSKFLIGDDIDGISGATISVYSMTTGVMKLSLVFPFIKSQLSVR